MAYNVIDITNGSDHELPISATSAHGRCKMADGTLIQWGEIEKRSNVQTVTAQFAIPFVNTSYSMAVIASTEASFKQGNPTVNGFEITTSYTGLTYIRWIAIGRWK